MWFLTFLSPNFIYTFCSVLSLLQHWSQLFFFFYEGLLIFLAGLVCFHFSLDFFPKKLFHFHLKHYFTVYRFIQWWIIFPSRLITSMPLSPCLNHFWQEVWCIPYHCRFISNPQLYLFLRSFTLSLVSYKITGGYSRKKALL